MEFIRLTYVPNAVDVGLRKVSLTNTSKRPLPLNTAAVRVRKSAKPYPLSVCFPSILLVLECEKLANEYL